MEKLFILPEKDIFPIVRKKIFNLQKRKYFQIDDFEFAKDAFPWDRKKLSIDKKSN